MNVDISTLDKARSTLFDMAVHFGPRLLVAILILLAGFIIAGWVARAIDRGLQSFELEPPVRQLIGRVGRVLVVALFLIMALQNMGVELLPLIAGLGVA